MTDHPLEPVEERQIDFYGDDLTAVLVPAEPEPRIYVPIKPISDYLGLSWAGQSERIRRDPVLSEAMQLIRVTRIKSRRGNQEFLALPLDLLPGWLFGISASRVREELRDKIIRYQRECFRVLWDAFKHDILPPSHTDLSVPAGRSDAAIAYEIATAVQHLARQQMDMEQTLGRVSGRVDRMAHWASNVEQHLDSIDHRLDALEIEVSPAADISQEQAAELALAVKAVGQALTQRGEANGYQRVYGELYRRYSITSYKRLPRDRFTAVMEWLHAWHQELSGEEV